MPGSARRGWRICSVSWTPSHACFLRLRTPRCKDVGCGLGFLLEAAAARGFDVAGIDCNAAAVDWVKSSYGYPAFLGDVMDYEGDPRDVVTMLDVIEHLPQPLEALERAASLTTPGGLLVVSTMDSDSLVSRVLGGASRTSVGPASTSTASPGEPFAT